MKLVKRLLMGVGALVVVLVILGALSGNEKTAPVSASQAGVVAAPISPPTATTSAASPAPAASAAERKAEAASRRHCAEVAKVSGGSYVIERGCLAQEAEAREQLVELRAKADRRILNSCREVATVSGGSAVIEAGCINQELEARDSQ